MKEKSTNYLQLRDLSLWYIIFGKWMLPAEGKKT